MPGNVCQVFSSKNIEKYHWGIYHLIESTWLYILLQDDKYLTKKKKGRKGEQGGQGGQVEADVWEDCKIMNVIWERFFKCLENCYERNLTWIFSFLKSAFYTPFRYFHRCHFLDILYRFLSFQCLFKFYLFSAGFLVRSLLFEIMTLHSLKL